SNSTPLRTVNIKRQLHNFVSVATGNLRYGYTTRWFSQSLLKLAVRSVAIFKVPGHLKTLCTAAISCIELANEPAKNSHTITVLNGVLLPKKMKGGFINGSNKRTKISCRTFIGL